MNKMYLVMRLTKSMSVSINGYIDAEFPPEIEGACFVFNSYEEAVKHADGGKYKIYAIDVSEEEE